MPLRKGVLSRPTQWERKQTAPRKDKLEIMQEEASKLSEMGHRIRKENKMFACTKCRVSRKTKDDKFWFQQPCVVRQEQIEVLERELKYVRRLEQGPEPQEMGQKLGPNQDMVCSRAKIKRMAREKRNLERANSKEAKANTKRARKETPLEEDLEIVDETALKVVVHESHTTLVMCGGYAGCEVCGRYASTNSGRNHLVGTCKKSCPKGSQRAMRRMRKGVHPHGISKTVWPNGESDPIPSRMNRRSFEPLRGTTNSGLA